jgi:mannose-1-phosphate guanylyltransferase
MKCLILAGGEGTRLRSIAGDIPKSLVMVNNQPVLEHIISNLKKYGMSEFILSLGYKSDMIISHFNKYKVDTNIEYVVEKERMGTAGPLNLAKELLNERFSMLNGDILSKINISEMLKTHKENDCLATIALVQVNDPSRYGVADIGGNRIVKFVEKPKPEEAPSNLINAGVYILEPEVLGYVPEGYAMMEKDVFPKLAEEGKLGKYVYNGPWFDLGTPESYKNAVKSWKY